MAQTYRTTALRRLGNTLLTPLIRLGVGPRGLHLLSVRGRKTGRLYTTPVNLVLRDGARYLVSPYRRDGWAANARAAGEVELRRGRRRERVRVEELAAAEAQENPITAPYFDAARGADESAFEAEASKHPVFRVRSSE
jgi:deazaflavin-dependent oxidoreductase (nitroreductase family)